MPHRQPRLRARRQTSRVLLLVALCLGLPLAIPSGAVAADFQPSQRGSGNSSDALLVQLRPGVAAADASQLFSFVGASEIGRLDAIGVRVVSVAATNRPRALSLLAVDNRVAHVEQDSFADASVLPTDPSWDKEWGPRLIRAPQAWEVTRGERSVVIAVVDTGVDANHPDLRGRVLHGWDFQNNDANPADDDGHGTAVTTVAAAAGDNGVGIAGMCWRCQILPVKVLNGQGHGTHSNIAAGIIWAADHGADVINLSIAGLSPTAVLASAVAYAQSKGAILVAAAGNWGSRHRAYPAAYPGVISVAATNQSDRLYSWSNRGSWVTLAAPGCAYSGRPRARWAWLCGTSLATPIVTGTVALMKSIAPQVGRARIVALLTNGGAHVSAAVAHGRLDAGRAVRALEAATSPPPDPSPKPTPKPTPTDTSKPTPTPTPKPTATPTPKPTATPTSTPGPVVDWKGALSPADRWDRISRRLDGTMRFSVLWAGDTSFHLWVKNTAGDIVAHQGSDGSLTFQLQMPADDYQLTVSEDGYVDVAYEVRIE